MNLAMEKGGGVKSVLHVTNWEGVCGQNCVCATATVCHFLPFLQACHSG